MIEVIIPITGSSPFLEDQFLIEKSIKFFKGNDEIVQIHVLPTDRSVAEIAISYGCNVPFLRKQTDQDLSALSVALNYARSNIDLSSNNIIVAKETHPFRPKDLITNLKKSLESYDSVLPCINLEAEIVNMDEIEDCSLCDYDKPGGEKMSTLVGMIGLGTLVSGKAILNKEQDQLNCTSLILPLNYHLLKIRSQDEYKSLNNVFHLK